MSECAAPRAHDIIVDMAAWIASTRQITDFVTSVEDGLESGVCRFGEARCVIVVPEAQVALRAVDEAGFGEGWGHLWTFSSSSQTFFGHGSPASLVAILLRNVANSRSSSRKILAIS